MPDAEDDSLSLADLLASSVDAADRLNHLIVEAWKHPHSLDRDSMQQAKRHTEEAMQRLRLVRDEHNEDMRERGYRSAVMDRMRRSDLEIVKESEPETLA